jgi:energy-coupling factor transport system permease protein
MLLPATGAQAAGQPLGGAQRPRPAGPLHEAQDDERRGPIVLARRAQVSPRVESHSLAWLAWGSGGLLAAFQVGNPLYLIIILLTATIVLVGCAPREILAQVLRLFLLLGAIMVVLTTIFSVVTAGDLRGPTVLADLPEVRLPALLGGIVIGGPISAEQLVWGARKGLRLWAILMLMAAFNASVNHYRLLRRVPAFLFHTALITTIALALVPQTIRRLRVIREAQQLRGHHFRGIRDSLALLAPLIAGGLERSLTLAEAMETRGYGRQRASTTQDQPWSAQGETHAEGAAAEQAPPAAQGAGSGNRIGMLAGRLLGAGAALLLVLGTFGAFYGAELQTPGRIMMAAGAVALATQLRRLSSQVVRTRYSRERWSPQDIALAALGLLVPALLELLRQGGASLGYQIFPRLSAPDFSPLVGLALLLLLAPALLRPAN